MNRNMKWAGWLLPVALAALVACRKSFLEARPDRSLLVPATVADMRALLDNSNSVMNLSPYLGEIGTDDVYTTEEGLLSQGEPEQHSYVWAADIFGGTRTSADWNIPYQQVLNANLVLEGLKTLPGTKVELDGLRGTALFVRALAFFELAQEFAAPYVQATAAQLPGVPLRLNPEVQKASVRGTLQGTYEQVLSDLERAVPLLPAQAAFKTRPVKAAALALLARVCLVMQDYPKAGAYAGQALALAGTLIDYNTLDTTAYRPFPAALPDGNAEVLYDSALISNGFLAGYAGLTGVDTLLYRSYAAEDLRRTLFFQDMGDGLVQFRGYYTGNDQVFAGLAVDELYLVQAECAARAGDKAGALRDLNALLKARFKSGAFMPLTAGTAEAALALVLSERRKELVYRNLRWADLRRLNPDPQFAVTLHRRVGGKDYTLSPGDPRYVLPIPAEVIAASGMAQNPR